MILDRIKPEITASAVDALFCTRPTINRLYEFWGSVIIC